MFQPLEPGQWNLRFNDNIQNFHTIEMVLCRPNFDGDTDYLLWGKGGVYTQCQCVARNEICPDEAVLRLPRECLYPILDSLWNMGIRPKDRRFEYEEKLKDAHLQDMRKLVFKDQA